jgi:hypothetical protein
MIFIYISRPNYECLRKKTHFMHVFLRNRSPRRSLNYLTQFAFELMRLQGEEEEEAQKKSFGATMGSHK